LQYESRPRSGRRSGRVLSYWQDRMRLTPIFPGLRADHSNADRLQGVSRKNGRPNLVRKTNLLTSEDCTRTGRKAFPFHDPAMIVTTRQLFEVRWPILGRLCLISSQGRQCALDGADADSFRQWPGRQLE